MKRTVLIAMFCAVAATTGFGGSVHAQENRYEGNVQKDLEHFVEKAFQKKNELYFSNSTEMLEINFSKELVAKYKKELEQTRAGLRESDLKYKKQHTELTFNKVEQTGDNAVVEISESVNYFLERDSNPSDTSVPEFTASQRTHRLSLIRDEKWNWQIQSDEILDGSSSAPVTAEAIINAKYKKPSYIEKAGARQATANMIINPEIYWNASAAVAYARQYAKSYNWNYRKFTNDCTNFISQAERAGGFPYIDGYYTNNEAWWYNDLTQTYTWAGAENHYWLLSFTDRASYTSSSSNLLLGDVIQIDFTSDGVVDHTMMVSKIDASGAIYIAQHTSDDLDKPLTLIKSSYPSATFYFWKMGR